VENLTKRLEELEIGATFEATRDAVREVQMDMLEKLRAIRSSLMESAGGASSKEMEVLQMENQALQKINAKQAYRIEHLVKSAEMLLEKQKS
jgi:hypothetical protein